MNERQGIDKPRLFSYGYFFPHGPTVA